MLHYDYDWYRDGNFSVLPLFLLKYVINLHVIEMDQTMTEEISIPHNVSNGSVALYTSHISPKLSKYREFCSLTERNMLKWQTFHKVEHVGCV